MYVVNSHITPQNWSVRKDFHYNEIWTLISVSTVLGTRISEYFQAIPVIVPDSVNSKSL